MHENQIASIVVDCSYRVHTKFGPGLHESVYEVALAHELEQTGLSVLRQQELPVIYEGVHLEKGFRVDLIVEGKVIVEVKSIEALAPVHTK
jgi:GxxExxY protein